MNLWGQLSKCYGQQVNFVYILCIPHVAGRCNPLLVAAGETAARDARECQL